MYNGYFFTTNLVLKNKLVHWLESNNNKVKINNDGFILNNKYDCCAIIRDELGNIICGFISPISTY